MEMLTNIATIIGMFEIIIVIGTLSLFLTIYALIILKGIYDFITRGK